MIGGLWTQLPTTTELRAIRLAYRHRYSSTGRGGGHGQPPDGPDEELLDQMTPAFESVSDTLTRLTGAEAHLRERSDRRSVFLTVYTEMTARVEAAIESGAFLDEQWIREYLVDFANRYRAALVAFERGEESAVPTPWQIAFRASTAGETLLIQDALLGISAHINYDLTYTLRSVSIDPDRSSKRRDHEKIDDVIAGLIDVVQRSLEEVYGAAGYGDVDKLLGSFDEEFTLVGLTEARSLAWRNAVVLTDSRSALVRRLVDWRVRLVSTGASQFTLAPTADRATLRAFEELEEGPPAVGSLLGEFTRAVREQKWPKTS